MKAGTYKRGFTLIELLVVVSMLMILAAALTTAITGAARRAKVQACITEAQEMTNAILAYENYTKKHEIKQMESQVASRSSLGFILGDGKNELNGEQMPVLFNAANESSSGDLLDPWGRHYYVTVRHGKVDPKDNGNKQVKSVVFFPNYNRRPASETEPIYE